MAKKRIKNKNVDWLRKDGSLSKYWFESFSNSLAIADISKLEKIRDMVDHEIMLSETAISEGQEKETRKNKLKKVT